MIGIPQFPMTRAGALNGLPWIIYYSSLREPMENLKSFLTRIRWEHMTDAMRQELFARC